MLVRVLRGRGHTCEEAEDGQQAVDVLRDAAPGRYDAVLMDFVMPRLGTPTSPPRHTGQS
jgi:CheY-like chemotaxis protein